MRYTLRKRGAEMLLLPPAPAATDPSSITEATIPHARKQLSNIAGCGIDDAFFALRWTGTTAEVRLKSEISAGKTQTEGGIPGVYVATLESLDAVRDDLLVLATRGCVSSREDDALIRAIVEKLPLPPDVGFTLRFGSSFLTDVIDLTADSRLQVISPIYSSGATGSPQTLLGYETSYYLFNSAPGDDRVRIAVSSATESLVGQQPTPKSATQNTFPFPVTPSYFRLMFRTDASSHLTLATMLTSDDRAKLNAASAPAKPSPGNLCDAVLKAGVRCMNFPPNFGVNPEFRVRVNGREDFIRVGGSVAEVLRAKGDSEGTPNNLAVRRLFEGHAIPVVFDHNDRDILQLILMPGDEINW